MQEHKAVNSDEPVQQVIQNHWHELAGGTSHHGPVFVSLERARGKVTYPGVRTRDPDVDQIGKKKQKKNRYVPEKYGNPQWRRSQKKSPTQGREHEMGG